LLGGHNHLTNFFAFKCAAQLDDVEGVPELPSPICKNGDVFLGYGSVEFIGLGFSVIVMLVIIEVGTITLYAQPCMRVLPTDAVSLIHIHL
jgi:hypothetical protein